MLVSGELLVLGIGHSLRHSEFYKVNQNLCHPELRNIYNPEFISKSHNLSSKSFDCLVLIAFTASSARNVTKCNSHPSKY